MPRTISEITAGLLNGEDIRGVALSSSLQRRMLRFFLDSPERGQGPFRDDYIQALKDAFQAPEAADVSEEIVDGASQPGNLKDEESGAAMPPTSSRWLLHRIEATGVGGVTRHGAGPFVLDVHGESLAVDGFNGQGKSSLLSLVMMALTGHRIGPHGPSETAYTARPVREVDGKRTTKWPPAVAYPSEFDAFLTDEPAATIRLTFKDEVGNEHVTERSVTRDGISPIRPGLPPGVTPLCVELSVLVPNRIAHVRVGEETRLVEVLVELIGLEPLRLLGEHVTALCHGSKNFIGIPKKADLDNSRTTAQNRVNGLMTSAVVSGSLPWSSATVAMDDPKFSERAREARGILQKKKSELFIGVAVAASLDLSRPEDVNKIQQAIAEASTLLGENLLRKLPSMSAVMQIDALSKPAPLQAAQAAVAAAQAALEVARRAQVRQLKDNRLRLKAVAARWHAEHHPDAETVDACPLCDRSFEEPGETDSLATELSALRREGEEVTRSFEDACSIIEMTLADALKSCGCSTTLPVAPVHRLLDELAQELENSSALKLILSAPTDQALVRIRTAAASLTESSPIVGEAEGSPSEKGILAAISGARHAIRLASAWPEAKPILTTVREEILGKRGEDGNYAQGTLLHSLEAVRQLAQKAAPIDEAINSFDGAITAHDRWRELEAERELRRRIGAAVEPLKGLTRLVDEEARDALGAVTEGTVELFNRIYAGGELNLSGAIMERRSSLTVEGRFGETLLDASHIANTSWLRAFLWAFALTLRSHFVEAMGHNPLPLLVLDDPQATFDHCNERQWAQLLAEMATTPEHGKPEAQLLVTSHDARLFDLMELHGDFAGRRAAVCGLSPESGVLRVIDGGRHKRCWDSFNADRRPETAQNYIAEVRKITEGKLGIILHVYGIKTSKATLNDYTSALDGKKDMPFFSSPEVQRVRNTLRTAKKFTNAINASHHEDECARLNEIDADDVHKTWRELDSQLEDAYTLARRFEFYGPRRITPATILPFPQINRFDPTTEVSNSNFTLSGRVAAATDGRVTVGDVGGDEQRRFVRHGAVRVLADTLAPIASVGDILILRKYGPPKSGDLVVANVDGVLRARRLREIGGSPEMFTLLAEPNGPGGEPPLVIGSTGDEIRIVDGVLFSSHRDVGVALSGNEAEDLGRQIDIMTHAGRDGSVWQVEGDSAVPVALDGQLLIIGAPVLEKERLRALDGTPVLATVESSGGEPERYFKRLRLAGTVVVLESIETSGRFPPIVCSLTPSQTLPLLKDVAPVKGVLFECNPQRSTSPES